MLPRKKKKMKIKSSEMARNASKVQNINDWTYKLNPIHMTLDFHRNMYILKLYYLKVPKLLLRLSLKSEACARIPLDSLQVICFC